MCDLGGFGVTFYSVVLFGLGRLRDNFGVMLVYLWYRFEVNAGAHLGVRASF